MRVAVILLLVTAAVCTAREKCKDTYVKAKCASTNREEYLQCTIRHRRSLGCQSSCEETNSCATSCDECDCDSCYGCSSSSCNNCCSSCCQAHTTCRTHHCCHKACHNTCRSSNCRESCNKNCYEKVNYDTFVPSSSSQTTSSRNATVINTNRSLHNVTTVIHVNNVVNNTNVIDAPIKINTTSLNNISIPASWRFVGGAGGRIQDNCCTVLSPRQCQRTETWPFVRCFHYRYKMCGQMCYNRPVVHTYHQQVCQQNSCQQKPVYVPQPSPPCAYSQTWPYVSCGRPQGVTCEGCYGHNFGQEKLSCSPFCYDDGYGVGPYYRQGPFYQPSYSPFPPCQMTGTCGMFGNFYGYQPNPFGGYMPGFGMGVPMGGLPYPAPPYGNVPYGYDSNSISPLYRPSNELYRSPNYQTANSSKPENASVSGPFFVDDPVLYNSYNSYPNVFQMDNITLYPHIQAEITPNETNRYAEIKIEAPKEQ